MWRSRRTGFSSKWAALLCAMKWVPGLKVQTFLLCSQARMRVGTRGGLKDSIFPVPLPAVLLLPVITTAHPTFWYFSLKVLFLRTQVPLNSCYLISAFSHLSCLPQFPLLCCCLVWNYSIWLLFTRTAWLFTPQLTFLLLIFPSNADLGTSSVMATLYQMVTLIRRVTATGRDSNQAVLCNLMMLYFFHCCHS